MNEYHKIETLFKRDDKFKVIIGSFKNPVYGLIKEWDWTEKIDGTNIRVILTKEEKIYIKGRSENAQLHPELFQYLLNAFPLSNLINTFWRNGEKFDVCLYCEGYGAGIQKGGGDYNANKVFRLFDVLIDNRWWLNWENTVDVANKLQIKTVPLLATMPIEDAVKWVKTGYKSIVAIEETGKVKYAEGLVGRTRQILYDSRGNRLIIKLKTKDFYGINSDSQKGRACKK